jgi:hypothetical protein
LPTAKGGESTRATHVYAFASLHTFDNHVGFASSSPVTLIRRIILLCTLFPLHVEVVYSVVHLEPFHVGNSPEEAFPTVHVLHQCTDRTIARSCEHM